MLLNFSYQIKRSKGRGVRISINRYGEVFLHVPRLVPEFLAKRFLVVKRLWVEKKLKEIRERGEKKALPFSRPKSKLEVRREYLENKEIARRIVTEKLSFWSKYYRENFSIILTYNKVSIKNTKTRLGSCSSRKNLNFSYKIAKMSESEQDYLVVHELCHLKEMNHSSSFWNLVSLGRPNYKDERKKLRLGEFEKH